MSKRQQQQQQQQIVYGVCAEQAGKYINSDNNNKPSHNGTGKKKYREENDQLAVERDPNASAAFNYECRVDSVTWKHALAGVRLEATPTDSDYGTPLIEHTYENLKFDLKLSKKLLLQKFFRHNEKSYAVYENLCRGCGYGVFEAHGDLCNFCQCLVNGVKTRHATDTGTTTATTTEPSERDADSERLADSDTANIYENICDKCGAIYNSEACDCDGSERADASRIPSEDKASVETASDSVKSEKSHAKLSSKRDKRSIFHGFIGSLKRTKQVPAAGPAAKHLEIVHHVDGYENVFRTQETFDLKRICELRRTQTSSSDQHIYGRLKSSKSSEAVTRTLPIQQSQSHDELVQASAPGLSTWLPGHDKLAKKRDKRPRISKPRLLRTQSPTPSRHAKESICLPSSVCSWMTSLRREVHNYHSFGLPIDDTNLGLCAPKSIPAKSIYAFCEKRADCEGLRDGATRLSRLLAPAVSNSQSVEESAATTWKSSASQQRAAASRISDVSSSSNDSGNCEEAVILRRPGSAASQRSAGRKSPASQMVYDFKQSLLAKQQMQQQEETQQLAARAALSAAQRAKRQAIYLKIDNNNSEVKSSKTNSRDDDNCPPTAKSALDRQPFVETAASSALSADGAQGLDSRRLAIKALTTTQKRCGIYERDSEFVNDILGAFEVFLQRESAPDESHSSADKATAATEVIGAAEYAAHDHCTDHSAIAIAVDPCAAHKSKPRLIDDCETTLLLSATPATFGRGPDQTLDVVQLIANQLLSASLNNVVIFYGQPLHAFLHFIARRQARYASFSRTRLVRKYQRLCHALALVQDGVAATCTATADNSVRPHESVLETFSEPKNGSEGTSVKIVVKKLVNSSELCVVADKAAALGVGEQASPSGEEHVNATSTPKRSSVECLKALDSSKCYSVAMKVKSMASSVDVTQVVAPMPTTTSADATSNCDSTAVNQHQQQQQQESANRKLPKVLSGAQRPQVPARDPKTALTTAPTRNGSSPPVPAKRVLESPSAPVANYTPTHANNNNNHSSKRHGEAVKEKQHDDDDIYQSIWKFKTVGEVLERYQTDADYYDLNSIKAKAAVASADDSSSLMPAILISNDVEDLGEWETDDEFMFTTQPDCESATQTAETCSLNSSTVRSAHSTSSITGSTVTGFNSSTTTLASTAGVSLMHHLFHNIGIFYSLSEPKLRAIIYDYDRIYSSAYFSVGRPLAVGQTATAQRSQDSVNRIGMDKSSPPPPPRKERSPMPPPRTTSAARAPGNDRAGCQQQQMKVPHAMPNSQLLPDSVQAWKFLLLDVNYLEDEEDMIVSENAILRAQEIKEDIDTQHMPPKNILQCYKSVSYGNLIDLSSEDDKKSIAERMRNKLQRGVFKLNVRSPKSEKKSRGIFRRAEATSLYLEDGMKPKYPIFGAPLEQLELNTTTHPNVPRFVVDCVEIIERKDCIRQDGLYRASGNKVYIDELKQKLSESYIYDPKLLVADDIHTLTSLLKLFFRELTAPLIPQEAYERVGRNLADPATVDTMRQAFEDVCEPNRSTLQFLIKHLTNVAACSAENRMPASNLAIVWGPCLLSANQIEFDIGRMNTMAKVLIENYERIFNENERLVS